MATRSFSTCAALRRLNIPRTPAPTPSTPTYTNRHPDLRRFDPLLDIDPQLVTRYPELNATLIKTNEGSYDERKTRFLEFYGLDSVPGGRGDRRNADEAKALHRYRLEAHRTVNMTAKGRDANLYALVVVGNGRGLVGYGEAKAKTLGEADEKAFRLAVRSMDAVALNDKRTIHGVLRGKFSACTVELRERPAGFGLVCGPVIHQIAKAAGIRDLSAKIYGSRNRMNVVKLVCSLLQGGAWPQGFGDGFGGRGPRLSKGTGMRTASEVATSLGRQAVYTKQSKV